MWARTYEEKRRTIHIHWMYVWIAAMCERGEEEGQRFGVAGPGWEVGRPRGSLSGWNGLTNQRVSLSAHGYYYEGGMPASQAIARAKSPDAVFHLAPVRCGGCTDVS